MAIVNTSRVSRYLVRSVRVEATRAGHSLGRFKYGVTSAKATCKHCGALYFAFASYKMTEATGDFLPCPKA